MYLRTSNFVPGVLISLKIQPWSENSSCLHISNPTSPITQKRKKAKKRKKEKKRGKRHRLISLLLTAYNKKVLKMNPRVQTADDNTDDWVKNWRKKEIFMETQLFTGYIRFTRHKHHNSNTFLLIRSFNKIHNVWRKFICDH